MKVFIATQRIYQRGGSRLGEDKIIGLVVAANKESALAAIPGYAKLPPDWGAEPPRVEAWGRLDPDEGLPTFIMAPRGR